MAVTTTLAGWTLTQGFQTQSGIGSMQETIVGRGVWTWFPLSLEENMIGSKVILAEAIPSFSGLLVESVTLMDVTNLSFSLNLSMDGSGLLIR